MYTKLDRAMPFVLLYVSIVIIIGLGFALVDGNCRENRVCSEAYADVQDSWVHFSQLCEEVGPLDAKEDKCRLHKGLDVPECLALTAEETRLRRRIEGVLKRRDSARDKIPRLTRFAMGLWNNDNWWCAERERSGTANASLTF